MLKFYGRAAGDYLKFRSAHVFVAPRSRAETRQQHHPEEEVHHDATVGSSLLPSPSLRIAGTPGDRASFGLACAQATTLAAQVFGKGNPRSRAGRTSA